MNAKPNDNAETDDRRLNKYCTCDTHPGEECPYPLHRALWEATEREFECAESVAEPMYIVALDNDAKTELLIDGVKTDTPVDEIDPILGEVHRVDERDATATQWHEPAVGIGVSYNREHRWAYICEKKADEDISVTDIHVERIRAGDVPFEVYCAHDDTTVIRL